LQKKEEIEYSINSALPESFMVDLPESSTVPVSPKKFFVLILSLIIPIGLSLGVISIKESFNNKILYRSEIENLSSLPILGEVIYEKLDSNIVSTNNQRSFFKEQFRQIRSSLRSFNKMQVKKRLVVTSSIQGEGKSLIATNLAISLANSGKKIALLELDLYQPKILTMFEIENQVGITDYLMNEADYKQIIIASPIPNLSILSAGNLTDSPSELLLNGRIEELFTKLEKEFDILIIDTPPVRPITDAFEIARSCDLLLYVIRHNFTPKVHVQVLDEEVLSHDIKNVALIFNGIKRRGVGKYSYGYGYGYGYDDRVRYDEYGKKSKKKLFA
jgi:capsular exopolysaccharide synthesis family protein